MSISNVPYEHHGRSGLVSPDVRIGIPDNSDVRNRTRNNSCSRMIAVATNVGKIALLVVGVLAVGFGLGILQEKPAISRPSCESLNRITPKKWATSQEPGIFNQIEYRAIVANFADFGAQLKSDTCITPFASITNENYIANPKNRDHLYDPRKNLVIRGMTFDIVPQTKKLVCDSSINSLCPPQSDEPKINLCLSKTKRCFQLKEGEELSFSTLVFIVINQELNLAKGLQEGDRQYLYNRLIQRIDEIGLQNININSHRIHSVIRNQLDQERRTLALVRTQMINGHFLGIPIHRNPYEALRAEL